MNRRESQPWFRRQPPHIVPARFARKPEWVVDEAIRLKAFLPHAGVRTIALTFNRLHRVRESVSKSYVAEIIRQRKYAIAVARRDIRNRKPRATPINAVWGLIFVGSRQVRAWTQ